MPSLTIKQQHYKKALIKELHISRRYQEYFKEERDEYEELLLSSFGVQSSKELSINQLIVFVNYMNFKDVKLPLHVEVKKDAELGMLTCGILHPIGITATQKQLEMMIGLWNEFASTPTEEALLKFTNRQTKKAYLHLHMISKREAQKIIPVLQRMKKN